MAAVVLIVSARTDEPETAGGEDLELEGEPGPAVGPSGEPEGQARHEAEQRGELSA